ncbi:MAG: hypothetical protein ABIH11_08480 [Candidatus Altiarchaeota archaeon]
MAKVFFRGSRPVLEIVTPKDSPPNVPHPLELPGENRTSVEPGSKDAIFKDGDKVRLVKVPDCAKQGLMQDSVGTVYGTPVRDGERWVIMRFGKTELWLTEPEARDAIEPVPGAKTKKSKELGQMSYQERVQELKEIARKAEKVAYADDPGFRTYTLACLDENAVELIDSMIPSNLAESKQLVSALAKLYLSFPQECDPSMPRGRKVLQKCEYGISLGLGYLECPPDNYTAAWRVLDRHRTNPKNIEKRLAAGLPIVIPAQADVASLFLLQKLVGDNELSFSVLKPPGAQQPLITTAPFRGDEVTFYFSETSDTLGHTHGFSSVIRESPMDTHTAKTTPNSDHFILSPSSETDCALKVFNHKTGAFEEVIPKNIPKKLKDLGVLR